MKTKCGNCSTEIGDYMDRKVKAHLQGFGLIWGISCPNPDCNATYTLERIDPLNEYMDSNYLEFAPENLFGIAPPLKVDLAAIYKKEINP